MQKRKGQILFGLRDDMYTLFISPVAERGNITTHESIREAFQQYVLKEKKNNWTSPSKMQDL